MKLGVIGCGKMGSALVAGAVKAKAVDPAQTLGYDPYPAAAESFAKATGASTAGSPAALAPCDVVLLCTKPQQADAALAELRESGAGNALLVSVAAGLPIGWLEERCPDGFRVIRCMPNTPALVGKGAAAFARGSAATAEDAEFTRRLLSSVGLAVEVPEKLLDAVTGLSGSGPAFVYLAIEALADGGVRCGLPREDALRLAAQTVLGAAAMVLETGQHPAALKDMVTSPGGTTIAGIAALEQAGFRAALIDAVTAATARSAALGNG